MTASGLPEYWVLDDRFSERLLQALAVSLVVHILLLLMHLPQRPPSTETGGTRFEVTLSRSHDALQTTAPLVVEQPRSSKAPEVIQQPGPAEFSVPAKTRVAESPQLAPASKPAAASESTQSGSGSAQWGSAASRYVHKPGEARVIFEINDEGRIGQIIWDMLPALTDEQFNRLEAAIRARGHPNPVAGTFIRETIDVRDYIGPLQ